MYFARGGLLTFDPKTGAKLAEFPWRARIQESVNASNPVVVGDQVLISECYGPGSALLRLGEKSLKEVWADDPDAREKSLQCHWNTPIYHDGFVYGCSGRHTSNAELRCVDWKTGKVAWTEPTTRRTCRSSLTMIDGHFVCLTEYGDLVLIKVNPKEYEEVSRWPLQDSLRYPCWASPVIAHGLLYVRGKDRLLCLELIPED